MSSHGFAWTYVHEICGSIDNLHPQKNKTLLFNDMLDSFVQDGFILVFFYCMLMRRVYSCELSCNIVLLKKLNDDTHKVSC
jgi:hypothetical protein